VDVGFGPEEGSDGLVVVGDEGVDVGDELLDAGERGAAERLPVRIENQISIWLSQEACVGV
jgi:hypothetical protein